MVTFPRGTHQWFDSGPPVVNASGIPPSGSLVALLALFEVKYLTVANFVAIIIDTIN